MSPNPVKPLFGTRQNLWSSTIVHDFPTFLYLFWVDELFWRRKKRTCFGRASTIPITSQPFCVFFPQLLRWERHDLRRRHGGRFERHGFAEAELGQDAERRTQLRSDGTEVLQRLGAWKGWEGEWLGRFWMILGDIMNDDHGVMEDMFIDFRWIWMWLQYIYGDIKWVIDGIWTKNHKQNMTGWCWWETFPSKWFFNQQKWNQHCDKTARHGRLSHWGTCSLDPKKAGWSFWV